MKSNPWAATRFALTGQTATTPEFIPSTTSARFAPAMCAAPREAERSRLPDDLPGDDGCDGPTAEAGAIERRVTAFGEGLSDVVNPRLFSRENGDVSGCSRGE